MHRTFTATTLAVCLVVAASVPSQASGATDQGQGRTCDRVYGGATFAPLIRRAWAERKWEKSDPVSRDQARRIENHRRCPRTEKAKRAMVRMAKRQRHQFFRHKEKMESDWCSPTPIASGAGCWEIPASCIAAESGGSWSAVNPSSGANGAYQLLGHGQCQAGRPVTSRGCAMEHHAIAEDLYESQGLGPWVAPAC